MEKIAVFIGDKTKLAAGASGWMWTHARSGMNIEAVNAAIRDAPLSESGLALAICYESYTGKVLNWSVKPSRA